VNPGRSLRLASALGALLLSACGEGPAPYGFDLRSEQRFRLESEVEAEVSGENVRIERLADFTLRRRTDDAGAHELEVRLGRYVFVREGPEGPSELAISGDGVVSRDARYGEQRLAPDSGTPSGVSLRELLARPLASLPIASDGARSGPVWRTTDPLLAEVQLLEWYLLALPGVDDAGLRSSGSREVPRTGAYRLGVQLALLYLIEVRPEGGWRVNLSGSAQRSSLELAPGLAGAVDLDARGETLLRADRGLERADLSLSLRFRGDKGEGVQVKERVRITLLEGLAPGGRVNSPDARPDNSEE
jgi:hypothetical protein